MLRAVLIVAALAVLVAAGVLEGYLTNRWGPSDELRLMSARVGKVPRVVVPWTGSDLAMDQKILDRAEATAAMHRSYQNEKTKASVSVLLLCGPPGPIGAHTPDICYGGLGYKMMGTETRKIVPLADGSTPAYWSAKFEKPADPGLEVCWAWGVDGDWVASTSPRSDFLTRKGLYKLYVNRVLPPGEREGRAASDLIAEFLTDFLPEVKRSLSASSD